MDAAHYVKNYGDSKDVINTTWIKVT